MCCKKNLRGGEAVRKTCPSGGPAALTEGVASPEAIAVHGDAPQGPEVAGENQMAPRM